jgi:hypothetical protein
MILAALDKAGVSYLVKQASANPAPFMLRGTGRELEVYDVAGPIFRLTATVVPIKCHGAFVLEDDAARELVRELAAAQRTAPGGPDGR